MITTALSQAHRRQSAAHVLEKRLWQDWERALHRLQTRTDQLKHRRIHWESRLGMAMHGVDPNVWWRTNRRIETGELSVAHGPQARRSQRVVYVTRPVVLALAARRDTDLHGLIAATTAAEKDLRHATRRLLAATTWNRALTVLAVDPVVLGTLAGRGPIPADMLSALRRGPKA
jgi:hypothetical protein